MSLSAILEVLNFDFSKFEQLSSPKFTKKLKFGVSKMAKNDIFGPSEFANSIGKIIKFQQIQALTSHYENFWSIVLCAEPKNCSFCIVG